MLPRRAGHLRGASWEGHVIEQITGELKAMGRPFTAFYFRTSDQYELDLVLDLGAERWAFEIKLTACPGPADMRRLNKTADLIDASRRVLVSQTRTPIESGNQLSVDLSMAIDIIRAAGAA